MPTRRRKVATAACNLEDTSEPESGTGGTVPEEPEPAPKDRHPMPWGLVIRDVLHLDVHKTFQRLVEELTLGDNSTEYGSVIRAVDLSARNLFDAGKLTRKAKLEDEKFAMELDKRWEVLRSAASRSLEEDKLNGLRTKAATLDDIKDRMLATWPDEVTSIQVRKGEMHAAYRAIESLEQAWRERCQGLRVLAQQFRSAGT